MTAPARTAAHYVLRDVHTGRLNLSQAQARARKLLPDPRDRALATEIATGTLRWRAALDHVLMQVSSRPLDTIDPEVIDLLRASAYQLLYLNRIPTHAIINDAVTLTRTVRKQRAAGFVNAVLRALASQSPPPTLPTKPTTAAPVPNNSDWLEVITYLSTTLSHPRWLVERWLNRYGFDATERWVSFNNQPAPITLRANTLKTSPSALAARLETKGVKVSRGRRLQETLIVKRGNPFTTGLAETGLFVLQDEASQLVASLVRAAPGDRVLDTCASPGGKTVALAGSMSNNGVLVAADLRQRRLKLLTRTLTRCGCNCARVVRTDSRRVKLPFDSVFDWVLVDAPCSGLGTLRSDPDIRWRRGAHDLPRLAATQSALLKSAAGVVAAGGRLVYATCSSEPEENEQIVDRFLVTTPGFTVEPPTAPHLSGLIDANGYFRTLPHRDDLNAFFAVVLRRNGASHTHLRYTGHFDA